MQRHEQEAFLRYYWRELTYLRRMGVEFARRYPKVAGRLELQADESPDPHVERLIESFAFLTARLQRNIDGGFPEIAAELLNLLHPHYLNPVPSMTVARFQVDAQRGKLTEGHEIDRGTRLYLHSGQGQICRFRTCYPVTLWPIEVVEAGFVSPDHYDFLDAATEVATVLRIRIETRADPFTDLDLRRLRFYISGDRLLVASLYELLFAQVWRVALLADSEKRPRFLDPETGVRPVGFGLDEEVIPYPRQSQPAYRLFQEYFHFPEKFSFFDVEGLDRSGAERSIELLFLLSRAPGTRLSIDRNTFPLGCTPAINLFTKTTEPIRVDQRSTEYRLVPDHRRERVTEIHSILEVSGTSDFSDETKRYRPFYSYDHAMVERGHRAYWHGRRVPSFLPGVEGTDIQLSFLDLDMTPTRPPTDVVYARTLCHNRSLARQIPAMGLLRTDEALPASSIVALHKPTAVAQPPIEGQTLWRLLSHLSLNHLSLTGGPESLTALKEILKLYSFSESAAVHQQINGIREMYHRRVLRQLGAEAWRGFCRGDEITLVFDEESYVGTNAFLLGSVLSRFFALYSSTNSFTEVAIRSFQREGEWKRWRPSAGEKILL